MNSLRASGAEVEAPWSDVPPAPGDIDAPSLPLSVKSGNYSADRSLATAVFFLVSLKWGSRLVSGRRGPASARRRSANVLAQATLGRISSALQCL